MYNRPCLSDITSAEFVSDLKEKEKRGGRGWLVGGEGGGGGGGGSRLKRKKKKKKGKL